MSHFNFGEIKNVVPDIWGEVIDSIYEKLNISTDVYNCASVGVGRKFLFKIWGEVIVDYSEMNSKDE